VVLAAADRLPVPDRSFGIVTASMALMVVRPLPAVLAEISRVLTPSGTLIATVPATEPLGGLDRLVGIGLYLALGRAPAYPNPQGLTDLPALLRAAGLTVTDETTARFGYRLRTRTDADLLLHSLYLPAITGRRLRTARSYLRTLAGLGAQIPVPLRRITATI
jgi:SAM-dependent methyltransferase